MIHSSPAITTSSVIILLSTVATHPQLQSSVISWGFLCCHDYINILDFSLKYNISKELDIQMPVASFLL